MRFGIFNRYTVYNNNNAIFNPQSYSIGSGLEKPAVLLREGLKRLGHTLDTTDIYPLASYDAILFYDIPTEYDLAPFLEVQAKLYLIILESDLILPENWDKKNHKYFQKIFTWANELVDNEKYFKIYWPNPIPDNNANKEKTGFCTLIAGNKFSKDKRELYTERVTAIKWFEKNHSEEFDLYGFGWDEVIYSFRKLFRVLLEVLYLKRIIKRIIRKMKRESSSYLGTVDNKLETLSRYKFCICYENAKDIPDYITEKIFDCFFSGTIPIYLGAPNVTDYIPSDIFIDRRDFRSMKQLYSYLKSMSEDTYNQYVIRILNYLKGDKFKIFSAENFAEIIVKEIL